MASPPSFDNLFNTQRQPRSQSSFDYPTGTFHSTGSNGQSFESDTLFAEPMSDEPAMLAHRPSTEMLRDQARANGFLGPNGMAPERQDSVPFDPTSSSTIIASAHMSPAAAAAAAASVAIPNYQFANYATPESSAYTSPPETSTTTSFLSSTDGTQYTLGGNDSYLQDSMSNPPSQSWGVNFAQQEPASLDGSSNWSSNQFPGDSQFEDPIHTELQRIISNTPSNAGTPGDSRVASPFIPGDQQVHSPSHHVRNDSVSSVGRSPSPFTGPGSIAAPSPPFHTVHRNSSSSLSGSPNLSKPQSPPALIIPNTSSSPALPSMVAAVASGGQSGGHFGNSLLPPVNPALEHLTGMAGISPIAPNADGPMITIQPSTPISGLKEGRGMFDRAIQDAHGGHNHVQNVQFQHQTNTPSPQPSPGSGTRTPSSHPASAQPSPNQATFSHPVPQQQHQHQPQQQPQWQHLGAGIGMGMDGSRPRALSDSNMPNYAANDRQAIVQMMQGQGTLDHGSAILSDDYVNSWRMQQAFPLGQVTLDPRNLTGAELQQQAQPNQSFRYDPSVDYLANMSMVGGNNHPVQQAMFPVDFHLPPAPRLGSGGNLSPGLSGNHIRRKSYDGSQHHASGVGTPGYGDVLQVPTPTGPVRGAGRHGRTQSEDLGRQGNTGGWTRDFLDAITNPNDGTLMPGGRSRSGSHSSAAGSVRSASPALSISSQGSAYSSGRMDMPDGSGMPRREVTTAATIVASAARRKVAAKYICQFPGCGQTFTRNFNLRGHLRSHTGDKPYKCTDPTCPKSIEGFARQHDCKRHMALHEGKRPFECEGCGKTFARLDALTRHHKSEQGQQCAITHPLPTNPDGSAMSESQYKAYRSKEMEARFARVGQLSADVSVAGASEDEMDGGQS